MVSDFRKKKLLHVFNSFFDSNGSGTIDKTDFTLAMEKISKFRGWSSSDIQYKVLEETLSIVWDGLLNRADADKDGSVSHDEWISIWEEYAKNPSAASDWQNLYCKSIFQLEDASHDGSIDSEEFSTVFASFGSDKAEAVAAFQKMAKGKTTVSWDEFQELWKEYFTTDDPAAPGNYIFGKTSF